MTRTAPYLKLPEGFDQELLSKWRDLVILCPTEWARLIGVPNQVVEHEDEEVVDEDDLDFMVQ